MLKELRWRIEKSVRSTKTVDCYQEILTSLLDTHATSKINTVTRPAAPWYTDDIAQAKEKRKLQHLWCKTNLTVHRVTYVKQCINVKTILFNYRMACYTSTIKENSNKCVLWRDLREWFMSFFDLKVQTIHSNFPPLSPTIFLEREMLLWTSLWVLSHVNQITRLTHQVGIKEGVRTCSIPCSLMRDSCYETLLPVLVKIINLSILSVTVPSRFKEVLLNPSHLIMSILSLYIETYRRSSMPSYFRVFWNEASLSCYRKPV